MLQIQPSQIQPVELGCRFEMMAADAASGHEFCVFDFPGCKGCPKRSTLSGRWEVRKTP
jgi:hypothetical protein